MLRNFVCVLPLLALACTERVESTDVRTTGIYPEITVTADGSGESDVEVRLKVGGSNSNTFLDLTGDDRLEVTVADETKEFDQSGTTYRASFDVDDEDTEFVIAFLRGDDDESAPASTVRLPAPFDLGLETEEASRSAGDDIEFTWEPAGSGDIAWAMRGDCIFKEDDETPDDGMHSVSSDQLNAPPSDEEETCTVTLTMERSRGGEIDSAFTEGGDIVAIQTRSDTFTSTP